MNLLSTVHYTKHVDGEAQKPAAITYYNSTKAGVDCMDQMVTHYSCKRPTKRWTFAFFCNMLDVIGLAAFCICNELEPMKTNSARRKFLDTLTKSLCLPEIENRMNNRQIAKQFRSRSAFESFFGKPLNVSRDKTIFFSNFYCISEINFRTLVFDFF